MNFLKILLTTIALALIFSLPAHAVETALTVQEISETAWTQSLSNADQANGNSVANPNGDVFLILSGTAGTSTVTITAQAPSIEFPGYGPLTKANLAIQLTSGQTKIVGPLQSRSWNNSAGNIILSFSSAETTSVAMKALKLKTSLIR